ncbi:MAG: AAA family ATPase [Coleofasciculus sp. C1-SOL-03]|jgi:DNA sulfur modification protein DndD|uniref:AAA family ATPase n=1 Tax=Coleofasciculus sp. C1-SOL-03 TaxID=3069522 RepID=UPI003300185B
MIFKQLTLENFRQFHGKQIINFSTDSQNNVTVIHGFNGSGKTTLLNALIWLFYGEFSPDFENPEYLETEAAFVQIQPWKNLRTSVKLIFQDKGRDYTAERRIEISKDNQGKRWIYKPAELTLKYIDETGEVRQPGNPQDTLEQLLPKALYPFFFFNGERIEKLASQQAYEQIESSVKVLLDIEVFDRAITHLDSNGKVAKALSDEVTKHAGEEGKKTRQERDQLEEVKNNVQGELTQLRTNLQALQNEKDKIDSKLSEMPELAKWQAERKAKEQELESKKRQLKEKCSDLARELSRHGYLVLVPDVLTKAKEILASAHKKGELPIPMKRQFVSELLEKGECICGRKLAEGEHPYNCVTEWRNRVGSEELEAAVSVTKAKLESLHKRRKTVLQDIKDVQGKRGEIYQEIRCLEEELSELSSKIGSREYAEDHGRLEARRREIDTDITNLTVEISKKDEDINNLDEQIQKKDQEIKNLDKVDEQGKIAQRRLTVLSNVRSAIKAIRNLRHEQLSKDLSKRLAEVWNRIAIKDYQASLDRQYHLRLTKNIGGVEEPVRGASTGEKQVLSLAFIGSLVDKARSTYDEQADKKILFKGGLYPLVIDSAFGQLEPEYKRDVARWIPTLAPQVIVLVSESQWQKEVEEELQARIGYEWVLQCSTSKKRTKNITLRGRQYRYVQESKDGFEKTMIVEVEL